jgi:hypothetical protein
MAAALIAASSLPAGRAAAQGGFATGSTSGNAFGAAGQIAITGELEGHLHNGWELRLHPAADYFIVNNVSVGGAIGLQYDSGNPSTTIVDIGARVGFNLNIVDRVGFWPTAGIFYVHVSGRPATNSTAFRVFAPFLFHIVPHLFVGLGPSFGLDLGGGGNSYGIDSVVGGWF